MKILECGCCGFYHKEGYAGDCRNDNERYNLEELEFFSATNDIEVISLEDQMKQEKIEMKKELTLKDSFTICKEVWTWCAETGLHKVEWPRWDEIRKEYGLTFDVYCAFCQYSVLIRPIGGCRVCPITYMFENCYWTHFKQWEIATTRTDRMKYAQLFLGQIEALEKIVVDNV